MEYYVLKQGRTQGPFTEADIIDELDGGRFSPEDLGQADNARHWTPLRRLFEADPSGDANNHAAHHEVDEDSGAKAPALPQGYAVDAMLWWKSTSDGVRQLFQRYPYETGVAFLVLGCVLLLLSYFPIFIVGPALLGALFGGGLVMIRGRVLAGLALCASAVFVPTLIWSAFFWVSRMFGVSQ